MKDSGHLGSHKRCLMDGIFFPTISLLGILSAAFVVKSQRWK
ncbi:putative membrane protein [Synechococcus sp. A15-28]|nr:putative membrane protein [Synechococcus sp. A15-28]